LKNLTSFRKHLIDWYLRVRRDLPWRRTRDPYRIWISEIMLQQTRVAAVIPYYEKFLTRFPDIAALAAAPEQDVLAHWAGLGYYSRARNLQKAAQQMPHGVFPHTYDEIRALPGIGDYTAAAISSISFGLPHAVVDGNVLRVLTRIHNDPSDIASPKTKRRLAEVAQRLLDPTDAAEYNQAIMELGATVCTPRNPACRQCPVHKWCEGYAAGRQNELPVNIRSQKRVELDVTLLVIEQDGRILLRQREPESGQLAGFWELPHPDLLPQGSIGDLEMIGEFNHQITHHRYLYRVARATLKSARHAGLHWTTKADLEKLPLTTSTRKALQALSPGPLFG
jgi:A/G-specific adenine glycosylase